MNAEAHALGMDHTINTNPSGFDASTVSTAADQLRVFRQATRFPVFRQIVPMPSVAFFTHVTVGGRRLTAAGVVLGLGRGNNTPELLAAAGRAAEQPVDSVAVRQRAAVHAITTRGRNHD